MRRLDDPCDNHGRGWREMTEEEVASLVYIAIRLSTRGTRTGLAGKDAAKADEAAKTIANAVAARLKACAVFGPARPAEGPSV